MSQIEVFNNEEFGSIRVIEENGKYLFCGLDAAKALGYYDDYMSRLCTRTLYDKDGTPHVCVDTHMKRCLEIRLIRAVMRA